ncbi:hypothetical protein J6590_036343 [Homalodisca vitripennis]|nr:hypothetical protein J6590_036343 [Homalodisca vitripennis]
MSELPLLGELAVTGNRSRTYAQTGDDDTRIHKTAVPYSERRFTQLEVTQVLVPVKFGCVQGSSKRRCPLRCRNLGSTPKPDSLDSAMTLTLTTKMWPLLSDVSSSRSLRLQRSIDLGVAVTILVTNCKMYATSHEDF